ncbi:unnamed protein product [Prorocentrum cordatum]|uniref:Uncharacterized protein n=1 Tax=Prorocentrum cordatum TaxID=2364126 RepID=A0ABN9WEG6_9DINO|nr:unnamed protein product [Polarella glacialis]
MDVTDDYTFDVDGVERGQKAAPADARSVDASWVPHAERIYIDDVDGDITQITDVITLDRYMLKGCMPWEVEYDGDGKGAVVGVREGSEPVAKLLCDLLKKGVYKDENGHLFIIFPDKPKAVPLQVIMSRFREGSVAIRVGIADSWSSMPVFVFQRARGAGCRVHWPAAELYRVLGVKAFRGMPSRWFQACRKSWQEHIEGHFPGQHIVQPTNFGDKSKTDIPYEWRCLPTPCVNTVMPLEQLVRWSFAPPARGGMKAEDGPSAAKSALQSLLKSAAHCEVKREFNILLLAEWKCRWPRPSSTLADGIVVDAYVDSDLTLVWPDVAKEWELDRPMAPLLESWVSSIQQTSPLHEGPFKCAEPWPLMRLLRAGANREILSSLVSRVLHHLALQLERVLAGHLRGREDSDEPATFTFTNEEISASDPMLDAKLFQCVLAGSQVSANYRVVGIACDKASPAAMAVTNTLLTHANNVGVACCPAVLRGVKATSRVRGRGRPGRGEMTQVDVGTDDMHLLGEGGLKRKREGSVAPDSVIQRQSSWLLRDQDATKWRPPKVHRQTAMKWIQKLDAQLQTSTIYNGFKFFSYDADVAAWRDANWRDWAGCGVAMDLGSDGVSGVHALLYHFKVNLWIWPDQSHMTKCVFEGMVKRIRKWELLLLLLISWNFEHGPFNNLPLFMEMAPAMVEQLEGAQTCAFPRERPLEEELWDFLKSRLNHPVGRRIAMCRFGAALHACKKNKGYWAEHLFERTLPALGTDMLKGKGFVTALRARVGAGDGAAAADGPTAQRKVTFEDKSLRACCGNACVVSTMTLSNDDNRRLINCIVATTKPLDDYHAEQNRSCRPVNACSGWIIRMVTGDYAKFVCENTKLLLNVHALASAEFMAPASPDYSLGHLVNDASMDAVVEDEFAYYFGQLCVGCVTELFVRGLWMHGWPGKMFGVCVEDRGYQERVIDAFRQDLVAKNGYMIYDGKTNVDEAVLSRHQYELTSNRQIIAALADVDYRPHQDLQKMIRDRTLQQCVATQVIEDMNGYQANSSAPVPCRKFRRPARLMGTALESELIEKHKYEPVKMHSAPFDSHDRLHNNAFSPAEKDMSMDFKGACGTSDNPGWFSPSVRNMNLPTADLHMMREALASNNFSKCKDAWLGNVFTLDNLIGVGFLKADGSREWYLALHPFPKSSVLFWPCTLGAGGGKARFTLETDLAEPVQKPAWDLKSDAVRIVGLEWKSRFAQCAQLPKHALDSLRPGLRLFWDDAGDGPFLEIACKKPWWTSPRTTVAMYAKHFGFVVPVASSLSGLLWSACKQALQTSDAKTVEILFKRLSQQKKGELDIDTILEVDDAAEVLDKNDTQSMGQAKESAAATKAGQKSYKQEYVQKATQVAQAAAKAAAKAKAKGKAKPKAAPVNRSLEGLRHIGQAEARKFIPEYGASIWRNNAGQGWCGHVPPNPRTSEPFADRGGSSVLALKAELKTICSEWLEKEGFGVERSANFSQSPTNIRGTLGAMKTTIQDVPKWQNNEELKADIEKTRNMIKEFGVRQQAWKESVDALRELKKKLGTEVDSNTRRQRYMVQKWEDFPSEGNVPAAVAHHLAKLIQGGLLDQKLGAMGEDFNVGVESADFTQPFVFDKTSPVKQSGQQKIAHNAAFAEGSMTSKVAMVHAKMQKPSEEWDYSTGALVDLQFPGELAKFHASLYVIVSNVGNFRWDHRCYPFHGISAFIVADTLVSVITVIKLQAVIKCGAPHISDVPNALGEKNDIPKKLMADSETNARAVLIHPGGGAWAPFGWMPLIFAFGQGQEPMVSAKSGDGPVRGSIVVARIVESQPGEILHAVRQNLETTVQNLKVPPFVGMKGPLQEYVKAWQ